MIGYNKGDAYEEKILQICLQKRITLSTFSRAGAGGSADIVFVHKGGFYNLEVKVDTKADFGQKMLKWENGVWHWCVNDETTQLYSKLGMVEYINQKSIIPKRYTIDREKITLDDKRFDQKQFEDSVEISTEKLFSYYSEKNCHYIQIGGYGFYYLDKDILGLNVPQFNGKLKLRFRAKTIHSIPMWNYGFYAVLKVIANPTPSNYDIEELYGRIFPSIKP